MKNFAVIGDPVVHSFSPRMHNWVFQKLNIKAEYQSITVKNNELFDFINKIRNGEFDGINVTIPYKKKVIKYIDEVNPRAKIIGAVNCLMEVDSKVLGNNTDWFGFTVMLKNNNIEVKGKSVLVLGAGGAAMSIIYSLLNMGVRKIEIFNRSVKKAQIFNNEIIMMYPLDMISERVTKNSIIINTTSIGMEKNQSLINQSLINKNQILIDIIYTPNETELLKYGKNVGAITLNGLDMFIGQGLSSLDLWFGTSISKQVNLIQLKEYLGSYLC